MDINNITVKNSIDQKRVFNEFIKYCKYCGITTNEYGQQIANITNGKSDFSMVVQFTPKEAKLGELDTIVVRGLAPYNYSLDELINVGIEMLGEDAFRLKEEVASLNNENVSDLQVMSTKRNR